MSSNREKLDWFTEHLKYEIQMMRGTFSHLTKLASATNQGDIEQYQYNLTYESFVLHARNLTEFFQNASDNRNYNASDFVSGFKSRDYQKAMQGPMETLHRQVFHMGRNRPASGTKKFDTQSCARVYKWLEAQIGFFKIALPTPYSLHWSKIEPASSQSLTIPPNLPASATNATSGSLSVSVWEITTKK